MTTSKEILQPKKRNYKHIAINGNVILVKTPVPYKTVRQREYETVEDANNKEYQLNSACKFLYDCMRLLGISKKKAIEQDFTLNLATGEKIIRIAADKLISHEMYMTIQNYNW